MNHFNDAMDVFNHDPVPQMHEGEKSSGRRRKKAKEEDGESKKRKLTDEQVQFLKMEHAKIKSQLDAAVMEQCHIENENSKMKRELEQAREQLQMLTTESSKGGNPSSSSTENIFQNYTIMDYWHV